ncbi:uncharacterized protein LOC121902065 isoform X1 [Scomber scombrus]|uniref:Uncharacterized protein LOC121902065 isoform X1 n=1 Tax=Scomber scombrus TaxID=13677 RepID=A0AAV1NBC0_SCOSC
MTPQQCQPHPSIISQKVQLTYKLFLLENARNTLEEELRNLTKKAYEEVQSFLNSSFSTSVSSDLAKALDVKCQTIVKLSASLKVQALEPQVCVQPTSKNLLQPLRDKGILKTDVLKFGPMLQNSLMASSIAKAVHVLGATLSHQQLKHSSWMAVSAIQEDDMMGSFSSSCDRAVVATSSSCHLEDEKEVALEGKRQPEAMILPPAIMQSPKMNAERPPILVPPIKAVFPEMSNPKPRNTTPLTQHHWGCEDDVQVQHQKQTSSQLLRFLQSKAKTMGALEVTVMEWSKNCTYASSSPQSSSPTIKTHSYQLRHGVADDLIDALAPKTLLADVENEAPVFRVKRVESSGSLTYTCVIATKTELWDIGDIFTEVVQGSSDDSAPENGGCQNKMDQVEKACVNIKWETRCTDPEHENNSAGVNMPATDGINIPEFQVRRFEETEVVVSHIVSPGSFYIQHADSIMKLQALVTDSWKASSSYAVQNCIPDIGTQVMCWFPKQEQWCRAQVTKICGVSGDNNATDGAAGETSIKVEVQRLDHGDNACLSLFNIKEMTPEMANLPLQAVQVSLANVTPVNGRDWSEEAVGWFRAMVHNRTLYARLYPQGPKVTVELFLEKGKLGAMRRGASLSLRLTQNGHAKHNKLKNAGVMKRSAVQAKMRKQDSDWEKYLISCYTKTTRWCQFSQITCPLLLPCDT